LKEPQKIDFLRIHVGRCYSPETGRSSIGKGSVEEMSFPSLWGKSVIGPKKLTGSGISLPDLRTISAETVAGTLGCVVVRPISSE
jgi:hypothetical protein